MNSYLDCGSFCSLSFLFGKIDKSLQNMKAERGWENVEIVSNDMRKWEAPEKADIVVSELLGSFGDNELSPECLDGVQPHIKPDGISIPSSYTSYVAPISSSRVWNEVKNFGDVKHFETAYVVKFHNGTQLVEAKECFTFHHPNPEYPNQDNSRYKKLRFEVGTANTLHGLAGYFDATLYKDIHISINPLTFSEGMFSWFPLFFPLRIPIYIPRNSVIEVHFWRKCSPSKVWYEWCVTSPGISTIHNPGGRSYWIGL